MVELLTEETWDLNAAILAIVITLPLGLIIVGLSRVVIMRSEQKYGKRYWTRPPFKGRLFYGKVHDSGQALHACDLQLKKNSGDWKAWQKKGEIFEQLGEVDEASKCYEESRKLQAHS